MLLVRALVSARTWLAFLHVLAGLVIGFAAFIVAAICLPLGIGLLPVWPAGLLVLGLTLRLIGWFARTERARFALMLGERIPASPGTVRSGYRWGVVPRLTAFGERATWSEAGYVLLRLPLSAAQAAVSLGGWSAGLVLLTLPAYSGSLPRGGPAFGAVVLRGAPVLAACAGVGLALLLAAPWLTRASAAADAAISRRLLGTATGLTVRVRELERSRARVVDAAAAERRRLERDLHDGAQQRLVALAMELGRAKAKFADDPDAARAIVDQAHSEAKSALSDLRNLVRGVHPPVLTARGLDAALSGLAALCPVPVSVQVDVPVRPKAAIESIAYFVVAETLTNVAKHSRASRVSVLVEGHGYPGTLNVVVSDDGIGGADPRGAGLSGLADRVAGVDGHLSVESPAGGPTIIAAGLPCG